MIKKLLKSIKNKYNIKIFLETNGTLPDQLEKIIDLTDIISMDYKFESSTGSPTPEKKHQEFILTSKKFKKELFVKAVISNMITDKEIHQFGKFINSFANECKIILQPLTSKKSNLLISPIKLLNLQNTLFQYSNNVLIIPQVHKFINML